MNALVEAEGLSRFYGMILGLNDVSFIIRPGITGVVGPNGSGKTTLFRLLTGQIRPSSGVLRVWGERPWANPAVLARLGYCPEGEAVPPGLRPVDWLVGLGMLSGLSAGAARAAAQAALDQVNLPVEHRRKPLTSLSKGMRQRVKLAQCLLHRPGLIILDEPMNGLDPVGREEFSQVLRDLAHGGTSIVISSHLLPDLEALCADFLLLRWGRIPRSANEAAAAETRPRWPEATTIRCADPTALGRFFFERGLLRGCDVDADVGWLHARWRDPQLFYGDFPALLLQSGVPIYEVRSTVSVLEDAAGAAPR